MDMYSANMPFSMDEIELQQPFSERILKPITLRLLRLFSWMLPHKRSAQLSLRLQMAGNPGNLSTADFIGIKGWMVVLFGTLSILYIYVVPNRTVLLSFAMISLTAISFHLPDIWLSRRITVRQAELTNALPDALDMLTIAVEAGLSFEQGMSEIVARWNNDLSREFRRVLHEIGLGKSRREALEHFNARTFPIFSLSSWRSTIRKNWVPACRRY